MHGRIRMVPFQMILSDLEWFSEIFNDTKHREVYLRQLSFLLVFVMYFGVRKSTVSGITPNLSKVGRYEQFKGRQRSGNFGYDRPWRGQNGSLDKSRGTRNDISSTSQLLICTKLGHNTWIHVPLKSSAAAERPRDTSCHWIFRSVSEGHLGSFEIAFLSRVYRIM